MKILVTGGAGYIGSACTEYLINNGHEVVVFDSLITGYKQAVDPRAKFIQGDLADRSFVLNAMKKNSFDAVMHFAALALVGESMTSPSKYFKNNICAGINLLDAAVKTKVRTVVFSSTAAVYGEPAQIPIKETDKQLPINVYGESKLCFEKILKWYDRVHGLNYAALRYFNAAGASENYGEAHDPETHLIPLVLRVALGKEEKIMIYGDDYDTPDGTCIRDYIHILDLAQAHMLALNAPKTGHYNLGTGNGFSVRQIIDTARKVTKNPVPTKVVKRRLGDPPRLIACSDLAKKELGWKPAHEDISEIIESAYKWHKSHPNGYT